MKTNRVRRDATAAQPARQSKAAARSQKKTRVQCAVPESLLPVIKKAARAEGRDREAFIRNAISEKIAHESEGNGAATPERLDKTVEETRRRLVALENECSALFYLWSADLERQMLAQEKVIVHDVAYESTLKADVYTIDGVQCMGERLRREIQECNEILTGVQVDLRRAAEKGGAR